MQKIEEFNFEDFKQEKLLKVCMQANLLMEKKGFLLT